MFYTAEEGHSLPFNPFKAIVAPRPIGWISTLTKDGAANLAPYSFFNGVGDAPEMVMFASGGMKDSARNAIDTGEFTFNFVGRAMKDAMNASSASLPYGEDEFDHAGLTKAAGATVACPRVQGAAAAMECKLVETLTPQTLSGEPSSYTILVGQVTGTFIDDAFVTEGGRFDIAKADPIMRAGYRDYFGDGGLFEMERPG
ncbi:flavin reductase family protein [Ahrensia sp. R2A130]|uniref:flavin reductase family protein n=1 Tax=Ahrensia sp. R2A130 TaxID=744979 RepID=UPI0001E0F81D|nr:flavin reductase family protein [Ahrensia sp. R2A130]EFL90453.1 flavoprotein oxygenase [Ahrensia sp. R2A130]